MWGFDWSGKESIDICICVCIEIADMLHDIVNFFI